MRISSAHDGGSAELVGSVDTGGGVLIRLRLRPDPVCEDGNIFRQHFDWTVSVPGGALPCGTLRFVVENAGAAMCSYEGYQAMFSLGAGGCGWARAAATRVEPDRSLRIDIAVTAATPVLRVAYFVPFDYNTRHTELIARCCRSPNCSRQCAGVSVQGREIDVLTVTAGGDGGDGGGRKRILWILCRQHPSETMAEWWAEGFLGRLLQPGGGDIDRDALLRGAIIKIIPCANPDGAVTGLTRTNARGMNLNREWVDPSATDAPETVGILSHISDSSSGGGGGCDFVLDVHGDEELPRPVLCCAPAWTPRLEGLQRRFYSALAAVNQDFSEEGSLQHLITIPPPKPTPSENTGRAPERLDNMGTEGANLTLCSTQLGWRYDCLAMTLEQCFLPPWSVEKSIALGRDFVGPMAEMIIHLRPVASAAVGLAAARI